MEFTITKTRQTKNAPLEKIVIDAERGQLFDDFSLRFFDMNGDEIHPRFEDGEWLCVDPVENIVKP